MEGMGRRRGRDKRKEGVEKREIGRKGSAHDIEELMGERKGIKEGKELKGMTWKGWEGGEGGIKGRELERYSEERMDI